MARILMLSHSPTLTTGYGRVIRRVAGAFVEAGHEVSVIAFGYEDEPHDLSYAIAPLEGRQPEDAIAAAIRNDSPDILFTLGDPWMFELVPELSELARVTWISYFAIDASPIPREWLNWLACADVPIVFSRWAQKLVRESMGLEPSLIYHGVDTKTFFPSDKAAAKAALGIDPAAFVVGCVATNQQRKNLPALIKAFAAFSKDKPETLLYLHTQPQGWWDVAGLFRQYGIERQAGITSGLMHGKPGAPDSLMATIYNSFDVFCLPTMGEGFGLPILEAQACGVPVVVTDCSACTELVADPSHLLPVGGWLVLRRGPEHAIVDHAQVASKLEGLYRMRAQLPDLRDKYRAFAQQFDWSAVLPQFVRLIDTAPKKPKEANIRFLAV